jgi:hypothetical protein
MSPSGAGVPGKIESAQRRAARPLKRWLDGVEFCKRPTALWTITGGQLLKIVTASRAEPLRDQSNQVVMGALEAISSYKPNDQRAETRHRKNIYTNDKQENPGQHEGKACSESEEESATLQLLEITHRGAI